MTETYHQKRDRETAEYAAWINSLKPGDEVYVDGVANVGVIKHVKKLTATQVVLEHERPGCEDRFRRDTGMRKTGSSRWPVYVHLYPVTQAVRDMIEARTLVDELRGITWAARTLPELRAARRAARGHVMPEDVQEFLNTLSLNGGDGWGGAEALVRKYQLDLAVKPA